MQLLPVLPPLRIRGAERAQGFRKLLCLPAPDRQPGRGQRGPCASLSLQVHPALSGGLVTSHLVCWVGVGPGTVTRRPKAVLFYKKGKHQGSSPTLCKAPTAEWAGVARDKNTPRCLTRGFKTDG